MLTHLTVQLQTAPSNPVNGDEGISLSESDEVSLYVAFRVSITLNHLDERLLPHRDGKVTVHFLS